MAPSPGYFWPNGVARNMRLETLVAAYATMGFEECDNSDQELGFEKIALYATAGHCDHAARQLSNGKWTSKLGHEQDIEHDTAEIAAGGKYGEVAALMKRPV